MPAPPRPCAASCSHRSSAPLLDQLASTNFRLTGAHAARHRAPALRAEFLCERKCLGAGTASTASAFWAEHRPQRPFHLEWLVPWTSLDSLGHMPETLAATTTTKNSNPYRTDLVSAALFTSTVPDCWITVDSRLQQVSFAPHLPRAGRDHPAACACGGSEISLNMTQSAQRYGCRCKTPGTRTDGI